MNQNSHIEYSVFLEKEQKNIINSRIARLADLAPAKAKISLKLTMPFREVEADLSLISFGHKFKTKTKDSDPMTAFYQAEAEIVKQLSDWKQGKFINEPHYHKYL